MVNKKDENYVYYLVAHNLKKQRTLNGLTQSNITTKGYLEHINDIIGDVKLKKIDTFMLDTMY